MAHRTLFPTSAHRRLAPLVVSMFFGGVALWVPVEKLFLAQIGFTPRTIGLMAATYAAVVPVLEVPTGILADRWSRRGVLVLANVAAALAVIVGGLSVNVPTYLVAAVLVGAYFAMRSGTVDAVVYDTLLEETGGSDGFERMLGRLHVSESVALVLGGLGGGALAAVASPRATYFATLPFLLVSTACLLSLREPRLHAAGEGAETRSLRGHLAVTVAAVRGQRQLVPVVALLVLATVLMSAVFEFGPLWLVDAHVGAAAFGPAWAGLMASIGIGGALAGRARLQAGASRAAAAALLLGGVSALLVARNVVLVTLAQVVVVMVTVVVTIVVTRTLHDAVPSDVRTGVSSGVSAVTWGVFLPFALAFGAVSERGGVHAAGWLLVAAAAGISGLLVARPGPAAVITEGPVVAPLAA
jgi:MFS family permease